MATKVVKRHRHKRFYEIGPENAIWAYRTWSVRDVGRYRRLAARNGAQIWKPYELGPARCISYGLRPHTGWGSLEDRGVAPVASCGCGFYGLQEFQSPYFRFNGEVYISGYVVLWGRVHRSFGVFRAEYAYPAELFLFGSAGYQDKIKRLARAYGIKAVQCPDEILVWRRGVINPSRRK